MLSKYEISTCLSEKVWFLHNFCQGFWLFFGVKTIFFRKCKFLKIINVETPSFLVIKLEQLEDVFNNTLLKKSIVLEKLNV